MKISAIMPSLLIPFPDSAPDREGKFMRAVDSFIKNSHKEKELIIISDGCKKTSQITKARYGKQLKDGTIILVELPEKTPREYFVGGVRQAGIERATGDVICNLDSDDTITPNHLSNIAICFDVKKYEWCYFGHWTKPDNIKGVEYFFDAQPKDTFICNANIAWRRDLDISWADCSGKRDNWAFISRLIEKFPLVQKIHGCGYTVRHILAKHIENEK